MDILTRDKLVYNITNTITINKNTNFGKPIILSDKNITQEFIEITLEEFED